MQLSSVLFSLFVCLILLYCEIKWCHCVQESAALQFIKFLSAIVSANSAIFALLSKQCHVFKFVFSRTGSPCMRSRRSKRIKRRKSLRKVHAVASVAWGGSIRHLKNALVKGQRRKRRKSRRADWSFIRRKRHSAKNSILNLSFALYRFLLKSIFLRIVMHNLQVPNSSSFEFWPAAAAALVPMHSRWRGWGVVKNNCFEFWHSRWRGWGVVKKNCSCVLRASWAGVLKVVKRLCRRDSWVGVLVIVTWAGVLESCTGALEAVKLLDSVTAVATVEHFYREGGDIERGYLFAPSEIHIPSNFNTNNSVYVNNEGDNSVNNNINNMSYTLVTVGIMLIIAGIELNPGPRSQVNLSIISQNCRGLSNTGKALTTIAHLKKKHLELGSNYHVTLLQETHEIDSNYLGKNSGMQIIAANGTRAQAGVAICLSENINIIPNSKLIDENGRYVICAVEMPGSTRQADIIVNIYAPNNHHESVEFFDNTLRKLHDLKFELEFLEIYDSIEIIMGGDWNFAFNDIDRSGPRSNNEQYLATFVSLHLEELGLTDSSLKSKYRNPRTWKRENAWSRIDFSPNQHGTIS